MIPAYSANLGFLWADRALPDAIRAAGRCGFSAVECHFPYAEDVAAVRAALDETALPMITLNTGLGVNGVEDFGIAARLDRLDEARALIGQAVRYADDVGCGFVSVLAGRTAGGSGADETYAQNLRFAAELAAPLGIGVLVEPISQHAVARYHVSTIEHALDLIDLAGVADGTIQLMVDVFHTEVEQGDAAARLIDVLDHVGHIQISSVPDRGAPDHGSVDYPSLLRRLLDAGWTRPIGAEYRVDGDVEDSLEFLHASV